MKIIIIGAGEVGFHIAARLVGEHKEVVIIDKTPEAVKRVESLDVQIVEGSGSSPRVLQEAGIENAEILLAVTNSDETNLLACMIADLIAPKITKLARIRDSEYDQFHAVFREHAPHIETIINPEVEVVKTIEQLMSVPGAVDVCEFADGKLKLIGVFMRENSKLANVQLLNLPDYFKNKPPLIPALIRNDKLIVPRGDDQLMSGDVVYFISEEEHIADTLEVFKIQTQPVRRVLIVGGGRIGIRLAQVLEKKAVHTRIIEKNKARCEELAEKLNKTVILHGDGSDQELLKEENIVDVDVVITLTNDEETNIMTSLVVKRMGINKVITKISKFSYFPLMLTIGMEQVVSSRLSAINTILQHIRRGQVLSTVVIKGEEAEVMEAVAQKKSAIVGKPLKNIKIPPGSLVAAILRDDAVIIPTGESIIQPQDRVVIFAVRNAVGKIEKIMEG